MVLFSFIPHHENIVLKNNTTFFNRFCPINIIFLVKKNSIQSYNFNSNRVIREKLFRLGGAQGGVASTKA